MNIPSLVCVCVCVYTSSSSVTYFKLSSKSGLALISIISLLVMAALAMIRAILD